MALLNIPPCPAVQHHLSWSPLPLSPYNPLIVTTYSHCPVSVTCPKNGLWSPHTAALRYIYKTQYIISIRRLRYVPLMNYCLFSSVVHTSKHSSNPAKLPWCLNGTCETDNRRQQQSFWCPSTRTFSRILITDITATSAKHGSLPYKYAHANWGQWEIEPLLLSPDLAAEDKITSGISLRLVCF